MTSVETMIFKKKKIKFLVTILTVTLSLNKRVRLAASNPIK